MEKGLSLGIKEKNINMIKTNKKHPINLIGISGKIGCGWGKDTVGNILQALADETFNGNNDDILPLDLEPSSSNSYKIKKFADKLKDIVCLLIGCTREQLEDREFKDKELGEEWWRYKIHDGSVFRWATLEEYNKEGKYQKFIIKLTPRKLLQLLGTECGRQIIHPNIWVNALFADYKLDDGRVVEPISQENKDKYPVGFAPAKQAYFRDPKFPSWIITDVRFPNEAQAIKDRGGIVIRVNRDFSRVIETDNGDGSITLSAHPELTKIRIHPSETALDDWDGFHATIDNDGSIEDLVEKVKQLKLV